MKKTLITLAALAMASVASAGTLAEKPDSPLLYADTYTAFPAQNVVVKEKLGSAFTMTLAINWDAACEYVGDWQRKATVAQVGSYTNNWWKSEIRMFETSEGSGDLRVGIRFDKDGMKDLHTDYGNVTVTSNTISDLGGGNIKFDQATYCVDGRLILTWTFDGSSTYTLSALKNDGTLGTATLAATEGTLWDSIGEEFGTVTYPAPAGIVNLGVTYAGVLDEADILAVSKAIPEPTTATLSLLALAGLAARRRRK